MYGLPELPVPEINWGYNCLTHGVHHGRPEELWSLPLLQATQMFADDELKALVTGRIHTDALIMVHRGENNPTWMTEAWAQRVKDSAEDRFVIYLEAKVDELRSYYKSTSYQSDVTDVIARVLDNRLNPRYNPRHSHDSINMLCRILGMGSVREVR